MPRGSTAILAGTFLLAFFDLFAAAEPPAATEAKLKNLVSDVKEWNQIQFDQLKTMGPDIMPSLVHIYRNTPKEEDRAKIAFVFYRLGWRSKDAKQALLADVHTKNQTLRLQAQWALGRVSNDPDVVDVLLDNMRHDENPLFRDKAACALAYDQIFLTEEQKARLYERLIDAMDDNNPQVRDIAYKALQINSGQPAERRPFNPNGPSDARQPQIKVWKAWLAEFKRNL